MKARIIAVAAALAVCAAGQARAGQLGNLGGLAKRSQHFNRFAQARRNDAAYIGIFRHPGDIA